jgi:hypothetical protein
MAGLENLCWPRGPRDRVYAYSRYGSEITWVRMPAVDAESLTKRGIRRPDMGKMCKKTGDTRSSGFPKSKFCNPNPTRQHVIRGLIGLLIFIAVHHRPLILRWLTLHPK